MGGAVPTGSPPRARAEGVTATRAGSFTSSELSSQLRPGGGTATERRAVAEAFDTWAMNHQKIYFNDVTAACAKPGAVIDGDCAAAEVFIVPDNVGIAAEQDLAAYVTPLLSDFNREPSTTCGAKLERGIGVRRARLTVRDGPVGTKL